MKKDKSLNIICAGGPPFAIEEKELFSNLGVIGQVFYLAINDSLLRKLYGNALAFVYPSLYEGFGIPIIEAFSCNCPNILSNSSCFPEIAGDAAIYFNLYEEDSLITAVESIIHNPDLRNEIIRRGTYRLQEFSWEKAAIQTLEVYNSCISS